MMRSARHLARVVTGNTLWREANKFAVKPSWSGAVDCMIGPGVEDFVMTQAVSMSHDEFLLGASQAALSVNGAVHEALKGNGRPLDLLERESLTSALHSALHAEIGSVQSAGDEAVRRRCAQLVAERKQLEQATPTLAGTLLVVGAQRDDFLRGGHYLHRLEVGSHLIVCDDTDEGLWAVERQKQLLVEKGCTVQLSVAFAPPAEEEATAAASATRGDEGVGHFYTLEASFTGGQLTGDERDDLQFAVADINGRTDGAAFWAQAQQVEYWVL